MKNIYLAYILAFLNKTWFWVAIWVLYYLRFTNYAGIGLIESIMIILSVVLEIPTGAIADLLGKKKTLILSFLCWTVGNFIMAISPDFTILLSSVVFMTIGGVLYSGTFEALIYDSLKENGKEHLYDKIVSNVSSIDSIAMAVCAIIGGYMYAIDPRLPFFASAGAYFVGAIVTGFLTEPHIDSEKFSVSNFIAQNKAGIHELFRDKKHTTIILFLLPLVAVYVFGYQFLNDAIYINLGFNEKELGFILAGVCIISAIFSQLTHVVHKKISFISYLLLSTVWAAFSLIATSFVIPLVGLFFIFMRIGFLTIQANLNSQVINTISSSKNRATTLSTFSLLGNLPYVLTAFFMGEIIDRYSAVTFAFYLGIVVALVLIYQIFLYIFNKNIFDTSIFSQKE